MPKTRVLESQLWIPRPVEEVFAFFEDPRNLEAITPPWLRFRILPPVPRRIRKNALVSYMLRLRGVPVFWLTRIAEHETPHRFVDVQLVGPYLKWRHEHTFAPESGGTRVRDRVEYAHAGGDAVERRFVRPDLESIFAYRRDRLRERFPQ